MFELLYKGKQEVLRYISRTWLSFKKYLHDSTGDLCQVKDKICLAIQNEFEEIKTQLSSEQLRISHTLHQIGRIVTLIFALFVTVQNSDKFCHGLEP